jgi:hypothetical protein
MLRIWKLQIKSYNTSIKRLNEIYSYTLDTRALFEAGDLPFSKEKKRTNHLDSNQEKKTRWKDHMEEKTTHLA